MHLGVHELINGTCLKVTTYI